MLTIDIPKMRPAKLVKIPIGASSDKQLVGSGSQK
jgi:hypothetical protein